MEHTGSDALATLIDEHRTVEALFDILIHEGREGRVRALDDVSSLLAIHNASEENVIYPAVHTNVGRPLHAKTLYHEQDDAEVALFELSMIGPDDPKFPIKAAELLESLRAHVKREEEREFKHLRDELTPEAMIKLTAAFHDFRARLSSRIASRR
jgi:hypothetical protein